jgi:hypothetical protein
LSCPQGYPNFIQKYEDKDDHQIVPCVALVVKTQWDESGAGFKIIKLEEESHQIKVINIAPHAITQAPMDQDEPNHSIASVPHEYGRQSNSHSQNRSWVMCRGMWQ